MADEFDWLNKIKPPHKHSIKQMEMCGIIMPFPVAMSLFELWLQNQDKIETLGCEHCLAEITEMLEAQIVELLSYIKGQHPEVFAVYKDMMPTYFGRKPKESDPNVQI